MLFADAKEMTEDITKTYRIKMIQKYFVILQILILSRSLIKKNY